MSTSESAGSSSRDHAYTNNTMDVDWRRLPTETFTLEQYNDFGGRIPIAPQPAATYSTPDAMGGGLKPIDVKALQQAIKDLTTSPETPPVE